MEQGSEEMRGMCHCGTVKLKVRLCEGAIEDAHRCNCSICLKKGIIMVMALVDGGLEVVEGKDKLTLYTFNTGSAKHYFCSVCGIYTVRYHVLLVPIFIFFFLSIMLNTHNDSVIHNYLNCCQ